MQNNKEMQITLILNLNPPHPNSLPNNNRATLRLFLLNLQHRHILHADPHTNPIMSNPNSAYKQIFT